MDGRDYDSRRLLDGGGADRVVRRASQLTNLGLPELIAQTPAEYVEIAQRLAGDLDELVCLRRQLRGQVERRLCNAAEFVADFEAAILAMHQQSVDSRGDRS